MIKKLIKELSKTNDEKYCVVCTVDSIDETALTAYCLPIDESRADLPDVRLVADTSKIGFVRFPKVGSIVIVSFLTNEAGYISDCNDVDKIYLNGSNYDGIVKVEELTTKLNNLENLINTHLLAYNIHTHAGVTVGSGATGITTPDTQTLTPTIKTDILNPLIKHGNGN